MDLLGRDLRRDHLPMGDLSAAGPRPAGPVRRWAADPLTLLGLTALMGVAGALLLDQGASDGQRAWWVPALFAVVSAGLALSGST